MTSEKIYVLRKALKLTQSELAQLLGVHAFTVSKWERGISEPSHRQIALLGAFYMAAVHDDKSGREAIVVFHTEGLARALFLLFSRAFDR